MSGSIPVGSLVTDVKLNGSQPVTTLKELKQAVSGATSAWKAQEAVLKSAGQATEAAKAKYNGLSEAVQKQRQYIDGLMNKQKDLKKVQAEADQTTEKGKQAYKNATEEIKKNAAQTLRATTRLESLTKQQEKAKSSLNYYSSGLAEAQKSLKQTQAVTKSYVERLKAEGKGYESAKAKLNGYKSSLENLRKQQTMQLQELSRIANETGKSSSAYKRQQVRVNETATSIANLNTKIKSSQKEVNKLNPGGFNKIANGAKRVTTAADKMRSGLKGAWEHVKTGATAAAAGIGAVGAAAISGAKKAGNLQQSYKEITNLAVTGGEKQKEVLKAVTQMQRDGRDMSIKYGKSQQSIAEAYEELIKRGYTTKQALGAMRTELQGSVASGDDFKDVVSVSSTTLESFNMRADSTTKMTRNTKRAVNELAYAADMTSTGFKDLGYGMSYVGASAHSAGFSLSETAAAMGVLSNHGLEASKAGTGLNEVINRLSVATGNLVKGDKKNALAKLGIKPKEITDSTGKLKSLTTVFGVLNKHMKGMSKVQKINIMKSLFGMTGEQAGLILANNSKYLGNLSKQVLKAGKNGDYVAQLSKKNSQTAQMQMARAKRATEAFTMTLGSAMLPAINKAGNSLAKFLNSKDGEKFQKNVGGAVSKVANGIVGFIEFITKHPTETKLIATGLGAAYGIVKLAQFTKWLNDTRLALKGLNVGKHLLDISDKTAIKWVNLKDKISSLGKVLKNSKLAGLATKAGKGIVTGFKKGVSGIGQAGKWLGSKILAGSKALISKASELGHKIGTAISKAIKASTKFSMGKRLATGALAGAAVAAPEVINAVKDRHSADKRSQDIGGAVGALAGGTLTSMIPVVGPMLAPVGAIIGKYAGRWGGQAVNNFTKGWQKNKPPKKFWSLENLGWSTRDTFRKVGKWGSDVGKKFGQGLRKGKSFVKKNSKELALTAVNPLAGIPALLYKNNPKFRKWANSVGRNVKKGLKTAGKAVNSFKNSLGRKFKKAWDSAYKHSSKGTRQIMRSVSKFAKNYVKTNSKANRATLKNFSSFGARLKKNHGNLFKTLGQTAKKQLAIEKKRWSSNWKNIKTTAQGIWKGLNRNASDMYKKLNSATHGGLGKVFNGFKSFGKDISSFWSNLWKGIEKFFSGIWDKIIDKIDDAKKSLSHLHIGGIHFANGTDWRKKYGVPAVVNDAPGENYREGLLVNGKVIPFPAKRNLPFWLLPGQDIINGNDMAKMFGHAVHYADGTVRLSKDHKYSKKNYELAKKRAIEDKKELEKLGDKISNALKRKDGNEAKRLTAEFNKLTKKYSADKKAAKKPDPHAGKVLVDQGLLIGAKSRIGHSVYIDKSLFKKLIDNLNKKKSTTRHRTTTHKRRSTTARRTSTRRYSSRVTTPRISSGVSTRISTVGLGSINGLSKALKGIKSKSIKVVAKASGTKAVTSLAKSVGKVKGSSHKVTVKTSGLKSLKSLYKATRKIKGKTHKVRVKASGTKGLKSLQKNITSVHKRIDSLSKATKKEKFGKAIAKQAEEAVKSLKGKGNFAKQFNSMVKKFEKDLKAMVKTAQKEFKSMWSNMEHSSKTSQSSMLHSLSSFSKKFKHDWSSLQSGVYKSFSHFWTNMRSAAGRGVNNVIRILNSAIGKIDNVISDFGGSKTAVSKSSLVHYAEGTDANGRLTRDTLAIVNDAKSGPRQEAIVTDKNDVILPKGNNVPVMLRRGWGVLNGTQTQRLGLPHFADGTGLSLKKLYEIAKHNWNNPTKTGNSMFSAISGLTGAMKELASGMRSKSKDQGVTWWSQLWKMVEDKVDDDDLGPATGLLKAVEKYGEGHRYVWGAGGPTTFDCSGLVMYALKHAYGIDYPHFSGAQYALTQHISKSQAKPGDLVFWGHGGSEHVGVYAGGSKYYSAESPSQGIHMNTLSSVVGYGSPLFGRVKGLKQDSESKDVKVKTNSSLQKHIKNQVGQGFWRTVQKIADKYGESSIPGTATPKQARQVIQRAMEIAGVHGQNWVNGLATIAQHESGFRDIVNTWDSNAKAGTPSAGWFQMIEPTFKANAKPGYSKWRNPLDQAISAIRYIQRKYGGITNVPGLVSMRHGGAYKGYANGGIATKASIFGEAGPEMAIPLIPSKSTRAWELIGKAIAILSANTTFGQQQNQIDSKEQKEEHEFRQSVLLLLRQLVNKSSVADIKLTTPAGRTLWEVVEPFSKAEQRAAMIKLRRGLSGR